MQLELRSWTVRLHRWVALTVGTWFALLGLTGALLVWHDELDRALNPAWFAPRAACGSASVERPITSALATYSRVVKDMPATQVMAPAERGAAFVVWSKTSSGVRVQHFVDAACGEYLGRREWGAVRLDRAHIVPAIYELHRSILSGDIGHTLVGIVGLLLLGVAITGAISAWPRTSARAAWVRTLSVKRGASTRRWYYDLHRATGMWLLLFLLVMSISGTYLCFPKETRQLVAAVLPTTKPKPSTQAPLVTGAPLTLDVMAASAERLWPEATWSRLQLPAKKSDPYEVRLLQSGEIRKDTGDTSVRLAADGQVVEKRDPLNAPSGDTFISWLFPLHSGEALGLPGRLAWSVFGLIPLLLFATGAWLWLQRRRAHSCTESRSFCS